MYVLSSTQVGLITALSVDLDVSLWSNGYEISRAVQLCDLVTGGTAC